MEEKRFCDVTVTSSEGRQCFNLVGVVKGNENCVTSSNYWMGFERGSFFYGKRRSRSIFANHPLLLISVVVQPFVVVVTVEEDEEGLQTVPLGGNAEG